MFGVKFCSSTSSSNWPPELAAGRLSAQLQSPSNVNRKLQHYLRDYAELARLGRATRARITQITKLLHLAPDIQEQILFLPNIQGLNERNLRSIVHRIVRVTYGMPFRYALPAVLSAELMMLAIILHNNAAITICSISVLSRPPRTKPRS
jgi:hypothetical protein